MNENDPAIEHFHALHPTKYPYIERLALVRDISQNHPAVYAFELTMASPVESRRLSVSFHGVKEIRFGDLNGLLALVIEIRSIVDSHWERLNYRVVETEADSFSFYCEGFDAQLIG